MAFEICLSQVSKSFRWREMMAEMRKMMSNMEVRAIVGIWPRKAIVKATKILEKKNQLKYVMTLHFDLFPSPAMS